jgi:hypothetical protein
MPGIDFWRAGKRRSAARAAQADDLARLLAHLYDFTNGRRGVDPTAAYVASEIDLYRERRNRSTVVVPEP